jgi:hypothetical protein
VRKPIIIIIVIVVLAITTYSKSEQTNQNYIFKGENEFWFVEYKVNGKSKFIEKDGLRLSDGNAKIVFTATYKLQKGYRAIIFCKALGNLL